MLLVRAWALCVVESGELFMDKARSKFGNAHHHRWNWQCCDGMLVVSAEDGIVEFVEELCLRFRLFDDSIQVPLQG